jgi:hypothetical protein
MTKRRGAAPGQRPLFLPRHLPERSSPSRVRLAAQNQRAPDRSGPFRTTFLVLGKGGLCKGNNTSSLALTACLLLVGPDQNPKTS